MCSSPHCNATVCWFCLDLRRPQSLPDTEEKNVWENKDKEMTEMGLGRNGYGPVTPLITMIIWRQPQWICVQWWSSSNKVFGKFVFFSLVPELYKGYKDTNV